MDLAHSAVKTLIDLVLARAKSGTGLIPISRMSIYRLRQAINRYVGRGIGKLLIETGCREEYRLGIPPDQIAVRVGVTSCFFELLGTQAISKVQAEGMRSVCRSCELEETEALLNGD